MASLVDVTGQKFARLTVVKRVRNQKNRGVWECLCDCGQITLAAYGDLRRGFKQSCGCLQSEVSRQTAIARVGDLSGQVFGRLTVVEFAGGGLRRQERLWRCRCICGGEVVISTGSLRKPNGTRSCGCLHIEASRQNLKAAQKAPRTSRETPEKHQRNLAICEAWTRGDKLADIAENFCVSHGTVSFVVGKYGLSLRGKECKPKWNTEFFERRDDGITAYWAGFLFADGCLFRNNLSLEIGLKDFSHLEKFCEAIAAPPTYARKTPSQVTKYCPSGFRCSVGLSYLKMQELLIYWGIAPRKTYEWHKPQCSTKNEIQGFLVGLIDGDGHISKNNGEVSIAVSAYTPQLIDWVKDALTFLGYQGYVRVQSKQLNCYQLVLATARPELRKLAIALDPWLYPYLSRKWDRLSEVLRSPMRKPSKLVSSRRSHVNLLSPEIECLG